MERTVEPEIMDDLEQAIAYDAADFSASHNRRVEIFRELAPPHALTGHFLDLGCGSGDLNFRFLAALPQCTITALDGSRAMIQLAMQAIEKQPEYKSRISFVESYIPSESLPKDTYATIMSNSFLHHLHHPQVLWETIKQLSSPHSFIFVSDLRRPSSHEEVREIVHARARDEKEVLQRDFYNSLCAAFEVSEVQEQLKNAGIEGLTVKALDDIHLVAYGSIAGIGA
jgi:SAM-dependent methyltransferase